VSSFVNPHDIVLFGAQWFTKFQQLQADGLLPQVDEAPSAHESLLSKPRCQKDYLYTYPRMFLPQPTNETYRQFYYFLMAEVHKHIARVYQHLKKSSLFDNTIVIYTSDHGELLGSHGGLQQKWYNAYNEALHVPLIISNPTLFPQAKTSELYTSHIDLLPTILGLAGIDQEATRRELAKSYSEAQKPVGRDLSDIITGKTEGKDEPIYFMTDDNPEVGSQMFSPVTGFAYNPVIQPKHVETVITKLPHLTGDVTWKYSRYYDNPRFAVGQVGNPDNITTPRGIPDEYECYDLNADPSELDNRMSPLCPNPLPEHVQKALDHELRKQHREKCRYPKTLNHQNTEDDEDSDDNSKP
jgi:Sulfatase